jgi:hypothetical protein
MSDLESISGSEILADSDYEEDLPNKKVKMNITYGRSTIPLHPCLARHYEVLITEENKDTFIQTPNSVLESVMSWGPSIVYINDEFITYELCSKAIENHDGAICSIKPQLLSKEEYYNLCLQSVTENGWNMKFIPQDVQTQELCDAAIKSICWGYRYCLEKFKTYENSLAAVKRNGQIIEYVPNKLIDYEMCLAAAKSRYTCLHLIPRKFITHYLCEEAVKATGENVKGVPDEFMSSELGWLAITSPAPSHPSPDMAGANIQYISAKYLNKEIIVESAKRWFSTYSRIPKECLTDEIEDAVLEISPYCIKYMKQTAERCLKAIKGCPYAIENEIKKENITKEMAEYIFSLDDKIKNRINILDYLKTLL